MATNLPPPLPLPNPPPNPPTMVDQHMPMPTSRDALKFYTSHSSFDNFFNCAKELARRCKLTDEERVTWAIRYADEDSESWKQVACLTAGTPTYDFDTFKEQVRRLYPHLKKDELYTLEDLRRVTNASRKHDDMDRKALGEYYRNFQVVAAWLVAKSRLSESEKGH